LEFLTSLIKLISSFLLQCKFSGSVEGKMSALKDMLAGMPQGSVLSPTLYNIYINDAPQTHGVHLALCADGICLYATEHKEGFVVRKLQHGLSSLKTWCECWNTKNNEDKTQGIYYLRS
jgi:hypothetical protein